MKALSVRQPWAWLIANRFKDIENRSWKTLFRGPVLIHAGQKVDRDGYDWVRARFPDIPIPPLMALERGGVVGKTEITECVEYPALDIRSPWFVGPVGFVLRNQEPLTFQPGPGKLGFFEWEPTP